MSPTPPLPVTEDTPPDMLAGSMDLLVVLPNGRSVKMSVERSTPMMDLLVQVTTANKIPPGGHVIQAMGDRGVLPYKPSTPIGALDTWSIQVVAKSSLGGRKAPLRPSNQQPFEQTFRLQVHLPRNQLFVTRVSSKIALSDILSQVCIEKNLDPEKYELRHPGNLDQVLDARSSLADYKLQEVVLVARSTRPLSLASTDIMVLHREEEKRRQQAKSGSTSSSSTSRFFGAVFKRSNRSSAEGSISSDSLGGRSSSPTRSDESASRSASPPVPGLPPMMAQPPPRPQRKRRPAPKPPASNNNFINNNNNSNNKTGDQQLEEAQPSSGSNKPGQVSEKDGGVIISHSRNSSDSSGYHEASVLSESPDSHAGPQGYQGPSDTLPRRSKLTSVRQDPVVVEHPHALSRSLSSLAVNGNEGGVTSSIALVRKTVLSASTTALASTGQAPRKKRVAPPPPPLFKNNETKQDRKLSDSLSEPVAPPRQAVGHRDDRLKTSSLDRNAREKAEGSMALDKSATLPTKTSLSKQGSSASSLENVSKTSLQSFSSMEEEIVEVEEEEEEDNIPLQKAPNALPVKDPIVEVEDTPTPPLASVLSSRRDADTNLPVDKLDAPPNPKPRRRPQQADSVVAFPRPVPLPRKQSIDLIESTEGSQTFEIVKNDELDSAMQEDLNDIKFIESNQNNDDTTDKESKEDTNNEEYNSAVENPPRDYMGGKELKIITKTKRDPKFDTFGLKSPTFQKSRKKWNFTDEQTLEHLSNVSINDDYMVEETDTVSVVGSMVDNSDAEVFSPLSRPDVEPTFTRPNFRKSPTDSELEPQILRRSFNRDGRFPSSPKQWRDRKLDPTGSATSLRSMGEMPHFLGAAANIGRWNNIEALHTAKEASPGWVLGADDSELEGDSQEEDVAADELPHEPDSHPTARHQRVSSKQEPPQSSSSQKPPGMPSVSPAALPPPDLVPPAAASSAEGPLDVIDWEYQLPAPPTAFRDTNSPALVEGETVVLADTGVFREEVTESSLDSGDFSLQDGDSFHPTRIHSRNLEQTRKEFAINGLEFDIQREGSFTKISRVNPLFDAQQFEIDSQRIDQPKSQNKVSDIGTLTKDKPKTADMMIPQEIIRDEPHIQKDSSRSSSNVSIHRPTIVLESNQLGQLSNFKITTYQIPREPDKLFEGEKEIFKKPLPVSNRSHRYGSVGSVGSFWSGDGLYCDLEGKKSTSYTALGYDSRPTRTKSVGNLAAEVAFESERRGDRLLKTASHQNVNEDLKTPLLDEAHLQQGHRQKDLSLQSLQVLRNILPQLTPQTPSEDNKSEDTNIRPVGDVTRSSREEEKVAHQETEFPVSQESCSSPIHEPTALKPAPEKESSAEKFYTYQGPPSINLSSWSERPKVKVDIKADSDYRIGRGKDTHAETPKTESAREVPRAEAKLDVRRSFVNSVDGSQILKEVAPPESSPPPTKVESTPLTMRLVSHNSVSSSKKSLSTSQILESIARENPLVVGATAKEPTLVHVSPSSLSPAQRADPSRVPIVRAVELKKPYKQQLQDNDSNLNVSINIVRKNEELLVNNSNNNNGYISRTVSSTNQSIEENPRTDSDSFTGVNSLAKKFSSGVPLRSNALGPKPFQPRAVSTYEFNNKDTNKVFLNDNLQKTQGGHNILVKSSSTNNVSGPNVTVTSYDGSRRFTSVVGINKTLGPPLHGVAKTTEGTNTQNIHQRPSGSSIVKVNGFTGARQPFMPVVKGFQFTPQGSDASTVSVKVEQQPLSTGVNTPKVRIQRSESAAYKSMRNQNSVSINQTGYNSMERSIGDEAVVKIQPGWRTGGVIQPKLLRSVSNASSVPPPPPPLMSGVVLRKTPQSRPKSFPFANPRDELMDAIRGHGGRERLRKVGSSGHSSLNVILKV